MAHSCKNFPTAALGAVSCDCMLSLLGLVLGSPSQSIVPFPAPSEAHEPACFNGSPGRPFSPAGFMQF